MEKRTKFYLASLTALAVVVPLSGCGGGGSDAPDASTDEILIGASLELSGAAAGFGKGFDTALELAVEQINAAGGIESMGGAQLKLEILDNESDPQTAVQTYRTLVEDGAVAVIGPITTATALAVKPTAIQTGTPMLATTGATEFSSGETAGAIYRLAQPSEVATDQLMDFLIDAADAGEIDVQKIGVLGADTDPGPAVTAAVEERAKAEGWEVVVAEFNRAETKDFGPMVNKLAEADVDLVLGQNYPIDGDLFASALSLQDWRPSEGFAFSQGAQMYPSFAEQLGEDVAGWLVMSYGTSQGSCDTDPVTAIADAYLDEQGEVLTAANVAAVTAVQVIATALDSAASTEPADVISGIQDSSFSYCDGINMMGGTFQFDEQGEPEGLEGTVVQIGSAEDFPAVGPEDVAKQEVEWPALR